MRFRPTLFLFIFISTFILSCKKDPEERPKTTAEKIQGRWQLVKFYYNLEVNGSMQTETITGTSADYADFQEDGTFKTYFSNENRTTDYSIINDVKLRISTINYDIKTLTDHKLELNWRGTNLNTSGKFEEITFDLKR